VPVSFLTEDQVRRYGRFADEPTSDQLVRYFYLDDADRAFVAEHRGDRNRLGVAVQLGSVRLLGVFLEDLATAPASAVGYAAEQLGLNDPGAIFAYANDRARWRHIPRIRARYGYRSVTDPGVVVPADVRFLVRPFAGPAPIGPRRYLIGLFPFCSPIRFCCRDCRCSSGRSPAFARAPMPVCFAASSTR